ncbi:CYFA0S09e02762g1_1 [Cyberlindnera fabianii]|uniref:CYFA0S09e02762g1_1 n=1 Tax=Cyberlindnera fabianii TaxID=36022 RepID=A0A061B5U6_CYBFA|nr:Myo-inositol transporter 2 [Cyberlindnera fabianii]CDR42400.1 CYFA0S09e02762g1_1 [Cyberlindnera fabianii]
MDQKLDIKTITPGAFITSNTDETSSISSISDGINKPTNIRIVKPKDDDSSSNLIAFQNTKPSPLILVLTAMSSISGFMFGYDTGYISSALVAIGTDLGKTLTYGEKEMITAATSLGALIFAAISGVAADYFGRKPVIMMSNVLFIIGASLQCAAHSFWEMTAGRFVMGLGIGIGSLVAPMFIGEIAPSKFRGRLTVVNCMCITGGQLIAYAIGAGLSKVTNGWRILVGLSMIPPALQFIVFIFLPDTPRFYIMKGKLDRAVAVLKRTHPGVDDNLIENKVKEINAANSAIPGNNIISRTFNAVKRLHTIPSNFRALIIACGLQGIQQFTGFNSLMYFSGTVFQAVGFDDPNSVSIVIAATNFVFTILAFFIIDRVGRRLMLLLAIPGMIVSLVVCAIAFHFLGIEFHGTDAVVQGDGGVSGWGIVVIIGMICYVATFAIGIGNVPWQQSELFGQDVRGIGLSYATATNWSGSLIIAATFLTMLQNITPTGTFSLFAGLCLVSWIFVWFCYPELSGLELEETQQILTGGFNIKASKKLASKRKKAISDLEAHEKGSQDMIEHEDLSHNSV